jgi:hypothetical protein
MSTNRCNVRASLCSFTFADGRQCRSPRAEHPYLCAFHARKDAQALAGEEAGKDIAYHLSGSFVSPGVLLPVDRDQTHFGTWSYHNFITLAFRAERWTSVAILSQETESICICFVGERA